MALSRLDNLYRQVILDHSSYPHHHGTLGAGSHKVELHNPTCGDIITLEVQLNGDIIENVAFSGHGCSISTASAGISHIITSGQRPSKLSSYCPSRFSR